MCGIAGFVSTEFGRDHLQKMSKALERRGPDSEGFFIDADRGIGLAHRRLSILDLSEAANQPFYSSDGRYVMVYNGEVYNYKEVAAKYGIKASTNSDTEIILEAFARAGMESVGDLNGMFAMAIWDKHTRKLFLIRDRVGVKPLYYCNQEKGFSFASELKSLLCLPITRLVNRASVSNFLYLGYIPGADTIFSEINKLMPGQYLVLDQGKKEIGTYWSLTDKLTPHTLANEAQAKKTLQELVESSVEYSLISDVPLGIFLSGGVDSSLVAAVAQRKSANPVKTFSIGFAEEKYNEVRYARQVADHIGSDHTEFMVSENEALEQVDGLLDIYDEPYADSSAIPTLIVSKLARQQVTVALSGDGGDELFMGYGFYYWARRLQNPIINTFRGPIASMLHRFGNNRMKRASKMFQYGNKQRIKSHIFSQEQYFFTERELAELLVHPCNVSIDEDLGPSNRLLSAVEAQSIFDIKNYLPEELLVKTDRASMHHSLEVRVPLLDHRIVEFAINLHQDLKLKKDTGKYLLKQVLYEYVPPSIFDRPKWGFAVPLRVWLSRDLKYLLDKYLHPSTIEEAGFVKNDVVQKLKREYLSGKDYLYNRLWALVILHKWFVEKYT